MRSSSKCSVIRYYLIPILPFVSILGVVLCCFGSMAAAQTADEVISRLVPIATFEDARSIAADGLGYLFVADSGRDVVVRMDTAGRVYDILGGPGIETGQFDDPFDIDPTNGLLFIVADAGNGRIQRFSREFMSTGIISVGQGGEDESTPESGESHTGTGVGNQNLGYGRPIAVASSQIGEVYGVDGDQGVVLKWNRSGKLMRRIGGYDSGIGALSEPVSLAVGPQGELYVADQGREEILIYDQFGSYIRAIGKGIVGGIRSITMQGDNLWVVLPHRLLVFEADGRLMHVLDLDISLVDIAHGENKRLFLLTGNTLYRARYSL